ncbi:MAG: DUF4832 domain-containing protein, partial [Anaerolineae bacterium]|nr:DUF4832 domain-containing protein [Anaerolineae bacterium]
QHDAEPVGGFRPTDSWAPGEVVVDRSGVALPAELPSGEYRLIVGVYNAYSGERLLVLDGGDRVELERVRVEISGE